MTITTNVDGAEITVDSRSVGRSPLGAEIFLDVGKHAVEAKLDGYELAKRDVEGKAGASESVRLELAKMASAAGVPGVPHGTRNGAGHGPTNGPGEPTPSNGSPRGRSAVPIYVAGGVALVALGSALYFELSRSANAKDADKLSGLVDPKGCGAGTATPQACADLHDKNKSANRAGDLRNVSLVGAGVAVAVGVGYLLWPTSQSSTAQKSKDLAATPLIAPKRAGLFLSGTF